MFALGCIVLYFYFFVNKLDSCFDLLRDFRLSSVLLRRAFVILSSSRHQSDETILKIYTHDSQHTRFVFYRKRMPLQEMQCPQLLFIVLMSRF